MKTEPPKGKEAKIKTAAFIVFILIYLITFLNAGVKDISRPVLKINNDAIHYFIMAFNLERYGIISHSIPADVETIDESYRPRPTAKREPGYPLFISPAFFLDPTLRNLTEKDIKFENGELILSSRSPCYLTLTLLLLTSFLGGWITLRFTENRILSIVALFGIGLSPALLVVARQVLSENLPALLLLGLSFFFYLSVKEKAAKYYAISGVLLGMLTLSKAMFQFAWIFIAAFILTHHLLKRVPPKRVAAMVMLFIISYAVILLPWVGRNYHHFGRAFITERGGGSLTMRAGYNKMMTSKDYLASFLYWVPTRYTQEFALKTFGEEVISHIDPSHPDSIHSRMRNFKVEKAKDYNSTVDADSEMIQNAVKEIKSHPFRHLLMCIPFAWRGLFVEIDDHFFIPASLISLILFMGFFTFTLHSLIRRKWEYIAFIFPSLYLFGMHVLLTWCNPRYNKPLIPILWITSLYIIQLFYRKIFHATKGASGADTGQSN